MKVRDAFISYGRKDSKQFAIELHRRMVAEGYDVWFDQEDIPLGVDFQEQIYEGIEQAHTFIFIIAPHSVRSEYCLKEVVHAVKLNKRIIPLLHIMPAGDDYKLMHSTIEKLNWIYFQEGVNEYEKSYQGLGGLLNAHKAYVRKHTEILLRALEWQKNLRATNYLLVGKERQEAEEWLDTTFRGEQAPCTPSDLHCEYIVEAKKNANNLMSDVYFSYASMDRENRINVQKALTRHNISSWTHKGELKYGDVLDKALATGIEQADNIIFFLSPESIQSKTCLLEIGYAAELHKRIIVLQTQPVDSKELPLELRGVSLLDFSTDTLGKPAAFVEAIESLLVEISRDKRYYEQHKMFLVQALRWERQNRNQSILLRGYNLDQAKTWLKLGKQHPLNTPTKLHAEFIDESDAKSTQLSTEVFVSYSRTDADFARKLNQELQFHGKTTWFDQESIASGADFQKEIYKGIEGADNFMFILSPQAVNSPYCADEVEYAQKLNKRFVTLLYRDVETKSLHNALASVQWINFKPDTADFHTAFSELIRTLEIDREYVQNHTKWSLRAMEWENNKRDEALLLRGSELSVADLWLDQALKTAKQPSPSALQQEYIRKSKEASEAAVLAEKRKTRMLQAALFVALLMLLGAMVAGFYAYRQSLLAEKEAERALKQQKIAISNADKAKEAQKRAELEKIKALEQERIANEEKIKAEDAKERAEIEKNRAIRAEQVAREQTEQAIVAKNQAETSRNEAVQAQKIAEQKTQEAEDANKKTEAANLSANFQLYRFNAKEFAVKAVEQENDTLGAMLALTAYDLSTKAYDLVKQPRQYEAEITEALQEASLRFDKSKGILQKGEVWGMSWDYTGDKMAYSDTIGRLIISKLVDADNVNFPKIKKINTLKIPKTENLVRTLTFNPKNSSEIVFGTSDGNVMQITVKDGKITKLYNHNTQSVLAVAYNAKNNWLVSTSLDKNTSITVWDIAGKKVVKNIATDYPIGAFILHQQYFIGADKGGNIVFWDMSNLEKQPSVIYRRYASPFYSIAYSDKGKHLVAGNSRGEVLYFQFNPANFHAGVSPNLEAQIFTKKHLGVVAATSFSQDGNNMASAGLDGIVMLWDLKKIEKGKIDRIVPVRMDSQNQKVFSVAFDQHGKHVIFGGLNQLHIRPINIDQLYQKLRGRLESTELAEAQWTYFRRGDLEKPQRTVNNK